MFPLACAHSGFSIRSASTEHASSCVRWADVSYIDEKDVPNEQELQATFDCENAFRYAWDTLQGDLEKWEAEVEAGEIYE